MADPALPAWRFALASAIGTSHARTGAPCQDAAVCDVVADASGAPVLIAIVSDGAGSAARSQEGSRIACDSLKDHVAGWLRSNELAELGTSTLTEWLDAHRAKLTELAKVERSRIRDFASTIVAAFIAPKHAAYFQVGDGAIVVAARDQTASFDCVFWPQKGEYENTTNFVTDPEVAEKFYFESQSGEILDVAVFTDGIQGIVLHYATQSAHAPFFQRMFGEISIAFRVGELRDMSEQLALFLASERVNARTDDDKTSILASRQTPPDGRPGA